MKKFTFIDLFAGAGGFSEGFLQASSPEAAFEFLLASDINENCELTHLVRYNEQLGLDVDFVRMDAKDEGFVPAILEKLGGRPVDVVCGGPPCQSFSLAGRRRRNDKKDQLFEAYLRVIRALKPRYFVMENVTGILTKEDGSFKRAIIRGIESILDVSVLPELARFVASLVKAQPEHRELLQTLRYRVVADGSYGSEASSAAVAAVETVSALLRELTATRIDYRQSKTDRHVLTVRHALRLLERADRLRRIRDQLVLLKSNADIDNDLFVDQWDTAASLLDPGRVIDTALDALDTLPEFVAGTDLRDCVEALGYTAAESLDQIDEIAGSSRRSEFAELRSRLRLYTLVGPQVLDASDHGVPQQRLRAVFIGCRNDQPVLEPLRPTVAPDDKVTVHEALADLDFVSNGERVRAYGKSKAPPSYAKRYSTLLRRRGANSVPSSDGKSFAEWCRQGRVAGAPTGPAPYYANFAAFERREVELAELHNHEASRHNETVEGRLRAIQQLGGYEGNAEALEQKGLGTAKRDYSLLKPDGQSPTVMTIADDYIHPRLPRALTVREMARLQSFDDSFVFQGKRTTGGDRRKDEVPQFTLVGNAVPPLLARALATQILSAMASAESGARVPTSETRTAAAAGRARRAGRA